jgi:hypothetical protein
MYATAHIIGSGVNEYHSKGLVLAMAALWLEFLLTESGYRSPVAPACRVGLRSSYLPLC